MSDATTGAGAQPVPRDMPDQQAGSQEAGPRDASRAPEAGPGAAASPDRDPATAPKDAEAAAAREEPGGREDPERPSASGRQPVPRDLQDQQATEGDDRWDAGPATGPGDRPGGEEEAEEELPDTDEAGTGRQGAPLGGSPNPAHPVPDEPAG
ncbi:hypothetical protein [Streptomyces sp. MJP52]|uniref:hypothetical protein n=1 Tax=Streptomyces sp. MJP52 TaxID=2940555 RepID=UPI00247D8314|nr:hypothetical protein [Streptomyces sp. MJP52]